MPVEEQIKPFSTFVPGNHLILGAAGVGKTRFIWSLLQDKQFCGEHTINIVLTDSAKRQWHEPTPEPVIPVDPFGTNMRWIAEPTVPGIYFASCDYLPRVVTFLECLANFARSTEGNLKNPVRVIVDFPVKFWRDPCFLEQLERLHYISDTFSEDGVTMFDIWTVLTAGKDLTGKILAPIEKSHLIFLNPASKTILTQVKDVLINYYPQFQILTGADHKAPETGFYYLPDNEQNIYLQE